jgi:hypothetical protein
MEIKYLKNLYVIERIIRVVINFASYSEACGFNLDPKTYYP